MKPTWLRAILFCALVAYGGAARATTSNCALATNGTACASGCIAIGSCMDGSCVATSLRADGTACSTESPCTYDDHCMAGVCMPGTAVVCPDAPPCLVGYCSPTMGCSLQNICLPDGGAGADDLGAPADLSLEPNDMCHIPPGAEFYVCDGADGPYYLPFDAAGPRDMAGEGWHVRGSHAGDCSYGGQAPTASLLGLLALVLGFAYAAGRRLGRDR